jgi:outer membrane protein assembly factor BamB
MPTINLIKMKIHPLIMIMLACLFINCSGIENPDTGNWTHFRGSSLNGIAETGDFPVQWSEESGIVWKTSIHGRGWSSPVIYGDQVWVTTATPEGNQLYAVCTDFNTGKKLHDLLVFSRESGIRKHDINSYASPTPAIEKGFVYVHYGSMGTACIDTQQGEVIWMRTDLECDHIQGPGSSPVLYRDLLILHYEGVDERFIVALDKSTGETVWKTHRQEEPYEKIPWIGTKAYVTPLIIDVDGRDMLISNGSAIINAYDPLTGEEIWSVIRGAESTVSMPFAEDGTLYFETGFMVEGGSRFSELMAVNPGGSGDITGTNVLWSIPVAPLPLATPVIHGGLIYTVDAGRVMRCYDSSDGTELWNHRVRNQFNSSPVFAGGNIYFSSTRGETIVIRPDRELDIIAENHLDGEIWATPAFVRNSIIVRTDRYLYRISNSPAN